MTVQPSAEKINTNVGFPLRHSLLDGSKENTSNRLCTQFAQNTACPRIRFADGWGGRRPRFSPALLESIRLAARIEEIIGERIELRHSGKVLIGRCPWHQSNRDDHSYAIRNNRPGAAGAARSDAVQIPELFHPFQLCMIVEVIIPLTPELPPDPFPGWAPQTPSRSPKARPPPDPRPQSWSIVTNPGP